jgi:hypothetical protein
MPTAAINARLPRTYVPGGTSTIQPGPRSGYTRISNQVNASRSAHGRYQQRTPVSRAGNPIRTAPKYTPRNVAGNPGTAVTGPSPTARRPDPFVQLRSQPPAPSSPAPSPIRTARPQTPTPARVASPRALPRVSPRAAAIGGGVLGAVDGTIAATQALQAGASPTEAIAYGGGVAVGSTGGAYAGTLAGAAIGTAIAPGLGTAIGGYVGAAIGGYLGGNVGGALGNALGGLLGRRRPLQDGQAVDTVVPGSDPTAPTFVGGQGAGVRYYVCARGIDFTDQVLGPQRCQFGSYATFGPVTGILVTEGSPSDWRPTSPHYPSGDVGSGFGIPGYSSVEGSVFITEVIRADGTSIEDDRAQYGDLGSTPGISPANPRPVPPVEPPPAPLWGDRSRAPVPSSPVPPPVPAGDPPPETTPPPDPAVVPAGLGDTAPTPLPSSQPSPTESIGSGATRADVPANTPASDRPITTYDENGIPTTTYPDGSQVRGSFISGGQIVRTQVNGQTIGEQVIPRGLNPGLLITTGVGLAAGVGIALTRGLSRGPSAAVGTALNPNVSRVTDPLTSQVVQPPPRPRVTPRTTNAGCRCNGPILAALGNLGGTSFGPSGQPTQPQNTAQGASLAAILAKLQSMQAFAEKAWKATQAQKILDVLTFVGVMHNAAFLSREVAETMSYMVGNVLNIFGIEDENGSNLDVFGWLGDTINGFFVKVFGQDLVDDARETWKKASAILRSASMIIWTVRSIFDGTQELLEWIGENTGKIGNALKRWGVVGFNAYPWMAERIASQDRVRRRYKRILDGLEAAEDTSSSFAMASGEVLEIQQELGELGEQSQAFKDSVRDFTPGATPDNSDIPTVGDDAVTQAQAGPEVGPADMERGTAP